tara:strand:+ start:223 stop:414 length:192 start_codon:yes stop_codon:yes gene_type:complete
MKNEQRNLSQRKTTLKWNKNGELSSIDMARIIDVLTDSELRRCEIACNRFSKEAQIYNLGMWW